MSKYSLRYGSKMRLTLLEFGWPNNHPLHSSPSLLSTAINDETMMQWLVDQQGADMNATSSLGESVLSLAI
ncbi:uncharacterized protein RCC_10240 [Ramularia collo-cygni]|uniref:Uncharacterized protein n=1 Tax=Ramularia collo-cygni TaxID=112498 RepID=A0A2D3VF81_9PEZI|nr:uncharacterized protein RCC_10240 [Ramularia collo-cygni]CZT24515.1 uncharacterized protein RCC_10240 [Ramularia collo-cygni]